MNQTATIRRVCVMWSRLGPYHAARLAATHSLLNSRAVELVALETASQDSVYDWDEIRSQTPYWRETMFPGRLYDDIHVADMRRMVIQTLDRIDPDAVAITSYSTPDARAALTWCRRRKRVAVMMFDSRREDAVRSSVREWPKRQLVRLFDAALVGGTPHVAYAVELGVPRPYVFTPFDVVDNDYFARGASRSRLGSTCSKTPYFLFVGRLTEVKNIPTLLAAYAQYRSGASRPWELVIVGDGSQRQRLETLAGEGVVFAGSRQIHELPTFYGRAGAFVLPSWKDTWGLVVNEAMAAGLPVLVSSRAGCAPDLVDVGRNGWTFQPDAPDDLARRLAEVSTLPETERASLGRRSQAIIASYRPENFAKSLWEAIEAGRSRSDRGFSLGGRAVLALLRVLTRRATSFHAIPD